MMSIKLRRVLLFLSMLLMVGFFVVNNCLLHAECPKNPICGGESLDYFISDYNTGEPISDGMIVQPYTWIRFDVHATAGGYCEEWVWDYPSGECVQAPDQPRTVNNVHIIVDVTCDCPLNGISWDVGRYFSGELTEYGCVAAWNHVLDNRTDPCSYFPGVTYLFVHPGVYTFTLGNLINNIDCTLGVCAPYVLKTTTISVGETYVAPQNQDKNLGGHPPTGCNSEVFVKNPTNVATGNKYEEALDLKVSTPGIPLEFRRSYNSQSTDDGPLGYGWTHSFDLSVQVVQETAPKQVIVWDSDGRALHFIEISRATEIIFGGQSGVKDRLKQVISTGEYFLRRKGGNLTYRFGSDGKLLQISDPNGNLIALTYTGGLLTQVSNNFGKAISIGYNPQSRIETVTDPNGKSVSYEYVNGDLTKVTYPDRPADRLDLFSSITYAYSNHNLTDKYDSYGNLIGHWEYFNNNETDRRKIRVYIYYSHVKDSVPQEKIELSYEFLPYDFPKTVVKRYTGATTYNTTTYTIGIVDGIHVVKEIEGCSTCGSIHKSFDYSDRVDLTYVTSIDDIDQTGITTHYTYDNPANFWEQVGEVTAKTEALTNPPVPEERTTTYTYTHRTDDPFLLTQSTETKKSVVDPQQNKVITLTYNTAGNILSRQEAGYVLLINGTPEQKTYTTSYQYNGFGQPTQINGPRTDVSDVTTFEYYENTVPEVNNRYQLKAIVNALGQRTEFSEYDANGNVGKIKDPNNVETQYTYDERNRIKTVTNLLTTAQTQYFYDGRGNLLYIILPDPGNRIDFSYNPANKLTEITDSLGNKIIYGYDPEGNRNREERKDPQGVLKKYLDFAYGPNNRIWKIINPDTNYTEYTYNGRGNPIAIKDPNDSISTYIYDALSRLTDMNQPLATDTLYGYDTQDNQTSIRDPNENTTQYIYDDFGRKNKTTSPDTAITKYIYDEAGNLIQKVDAKGTIVNYTYDALNRPTAIQFPSDPNQNVTFTYDSLSVSNGIGRLTGRTDPSGSYVFQYDAHGNVTREEKTINSVLYTTQYTFNKSNFMTSITYPTGRVITYIPDQVGRISQVSTTLNGQPKTLASTINYLPFGGVTGLIYGNGLSLNQGYDNQYRISSIVVGSLVNVTYGYDPNGNITSILDTINPPGVEVLEVPETYSYQAGTNKLMHIVATPPVDYGYDANANITTKNNWTYVYDLSNQLIRVLDGANQIAEYTFNGAGQRIKKVTQTETRIFHYDLLGHIIGETNQTGQMLAEYVYFGDHLLAMMKPGELAYYFHNDHLGTPQVLTNDNQGIAWRATYTPFGEAVISTATVENPFRYPGQYYDPETGLHYNYFRYYNPPIGRYITPDPIGLEGGINLFTYVKNNPINRRDPLGLVDTECWNAAKEKFAKCIIPISAGISFFADMTLAACLLSGVGTGPCMAAFAVSEGPEIVALAACFIESKKVYDDCREKKKGKNCDPGYW